MKILLVDDNTLLLDGLSNLLAKSAYEVVEKAHTIEEALKYFDETEFDILVTDFNIVDDNGLILIRKVKQIYPNLKIIVLSMHDEAHLIKEILKEGVDGYVLRKETHHELVEALDKVKKGKIYLSNEINDLIHNALNHTDDTLKLTEKEREVLKLIANNHSKKGIATVMHLSDRSVNTICRSLFKKTKTTSIVSLLKFSYANNLV
jgi:DNA-binding NarL/FixJ family response regulator